LELQKIWNDLFYTPGIYKIHRYHFGTGNGPMNKKERVYELAATNTAIPDLEDWKHIDGKEQAAEDGDDNDDDQDPKHSRGPEG